MQADVEDSSGLGLESVLVDGSGGQLQPAFTTTGVSDTHSRRAALDKLEGRSARRRERSIYIGLEGGANRRDWESKTGGKQTFGHWDSDRKEERDRLGTRGQGLGWRFGLVLVGLLVFAAGLLPAMASSVPMTRRTGALKTEMSPAEPSRPQTSNSGKTTTDDKSSVRKSIEARRKERRAAVDSAREAFYGQDNKSSTSFVYVSPADAESRSSSRTVTAPPQPDKTTQLLLSLPSIPPRKTSTPLRYQRQSHRRTASSEIDAFPLPPTHTNHPQTSPTSPAIGFSYNKTPMSPPTPPRPPGGRAAQVLTLKEKLNRALTRRRDKLDLTKPPPAFDAQRPGSNGESLPLTYTSTHSRSQSGVSTPPTQCSNPSPTMPTEGYGQFPQSKSGNESDWVTDWGTHESLYYEDDDEGYLPAIRPNSARAVRPMDTIEEEEQARLNRRTAFANLHNPMRQNAPTSSSFETGLVLSSSMELYGESIDDRQALASFDFGLDRSDSRNVHLDENGRPDSFGSNYIPSDSEDGYEDCSPSPSRNDIYDSMVSMDDEEDITRQVGIQSSYLTDESLAAKAVDEEERGRLAKEFPTVQAYLRAQASSPPPVPQIKDRGTFLDPKTPEDRRGQSYLDAKTPDETNNNALSFLDVITASSESDIPPIGLAIGDNTNRTAGPHAQTSGVVPAANASSTVLGNQSLRSGNSSSDQSRLSSFRTQTGSSSQGTGIMRRGTSSSARGSHRPGVSRNSSSYMNVDIRTPEEEQNVHRNLEDQIRRLSKISASSSSGDTRSGFAVVVVAHGDGPHSGPSIRGSIEIISGGSKSVTPRTPASRMLSGDEAGEQNDGKDGDDQSTTSDHSYNDKHVSISSEDELIQPPRKLLPAQKLQPGVKVHPADARYDQ